MPRRISESTALSNIAAVIGCRTLVPCPSCGTDTPVSLHGGPSLCLPCTEADIGEYADELAMRVSRKMIKSRFYKLPRDLDGRPILPSLSYRDWRKLWR